ncbi:MAG TPA: LptF/LptG family permease [Planctomycetota bacterium]|nr:LptF/LptG family permease [Planctomycetota bacterium]
MLSILDRYITRSILYSYVVCAVALVGLTMVLDAFSRIKDFMDAAHAPGGPGMGVLSVMIEYYSVRLPLFYHTVSPAIMLSAAMFCVAQLNRNNELVPMRASGISLFRILTPVFLFAIVVTAFLAVNQEKIIPTLVNKIKYTESLLEGGATSIFDTLDLDDERGNNWDIPRYKQGEDIMEGTVLLKSYYPKTRSRRVHVTAASGKWKRTVSDGVPRWHLSNGTETRYDENGRRLDADEGDYDPRFGEEGYIVLRPGDVSRDPFRIVSNFRPIDITPEDTSVLYQGSSRLREIYAFDPSRTDVAVALYSRYAFPLSNLVLLLLGLPFVLGTESKGTFAGLAICVVICAAFYGIHALCAELGKEATLSPAAAAWLPIALFTPLGLFLFDGVRT